MIKHAYKFALIACVMLLLSACVTAPSRQALQDKTNIQSTRIVLNSTQRDIVMQHNNWFNSDFCDPYAPMDSGAIVHHNAGTKVNQGLIGDLLVSGIQHVGASHAIAAMQPVRESLEDFDFLQYFNTQLKKNVAQLPWLKVQKQEIRYDLKDDESAIIAHYNEDSILFIGTTYALNSTFKRLEVVAYVELIKKPVANQNPLTLYANNFYFIDTLSPPNENAAQNKIRWTENQGSLLKSKLRSAASLLSNIIAIDIGHTNSESYSATQPVEFRTVEGYKAKGRIIKHMNDYDLVLLDKAGDYGYINSLYIINANKRDK